MTVIVVGMAAAGTAGAQLSEDRFEENDDRSSATDITRDIYYVDLNIDDDTDEDYYAVSVNEGETIDTEVLFSHADGDVDLELLAPNGTVVAGSRSLTDDESISHTASQSGTYYVVVDGFGGDTASYELISTVGQGSDTVTDTETATATDSVSQYSADRFEENDGQSTATSISRDIYYIDLNIDDDTDEDYYAVSVNEGETIDTEILFSDAEGDIDMDLLAPDGTEVADSISTTDDESISHTASQSGTYYVVVDGFAGDTASYELISTVSEGSDTVTETETATDSASEYSPDRFEENDGQSTATGISRDIYYIDLNIDDDTDEDYYSVSVNEGETIDTEILFSDAEGDIDMDLIAPDGTFVAGSSSVTDDESISHTATQSGTYYVVVDGFAGDTASYELISTVSEGSDTVTETETATAIDGGTYSADRFEENDGQSSATGISRDIYYTDLNIDDESDEDYYAVSVNAGERIDTEVLFSHADGDIDLELLAPNGTVVAGSRSLTDDESISHIASQSGTYYIVVDGYLGDTASYELVSTVSEGGDTVTETETEAPTDSQYSPDRFEENDGQSTATSISRDIYYIDLNIDDESDEDYYSVSVNEGERIDTEVLFSDAEGDIDLGLLAPDGTFVAGSSSVTDDESISHTATQSGTYHIVVDGYLGDTASYELISTVSEGSDTVTETDTPSSGADLRSIGPGMTASGEIDGLDPSGYRGNYEPVTFQGAAGQEVTVEMSSETGDTYLILLDPSGNTVAADDDSGEGFLDSRLSHTLESSGQYTIVATSFNDMATFPYDLTLSISGESDASTDTIDLSANSTATAAGTIRVTYTLENTGDSTQAVVLNAGSGIDSLSGNWQTDSHQDAGGIWRSSEGAWLFDDLQPGETVSPSVTLTVPQDASGTYVLSTTAENDDGTTSTTVELRPGDLTIAEAVDTNGNGALDDSEILAAIEAWRTDSTVSGTNVRLSNSQIIDLIELWRQGGA